MNTSPLAPTELLGPLSARRAVRKAVILAAGRGRRMGGPTADRPKAALEVGGHALIDWQIAALRRAGATQIAVVTGHGAAAIGGRAVDYIHNRAWAAGTQVDSLLCARPWIGDEPVIVSYGDILYHPSAALALLERPGDIVIAYDADHRWLWKRRFGDWLKDSETFRLNAGQVVAEIGGRPRDIEEIEGQFMGLMLFTPAGLERCAEVHRALAAKPDHGVDFTGLLSRLVQLGARIDTAVNLLPWMEIDSAKDLAIAEQMASGDRLLERKPDLVFPGAGAAIEGFATAQDAFADAAVTDRSSLAHLAFAPGVSSVTGAFAIQNWGRSGSTYLQSLFDDHPRVLSTPHFYSRAYFSVWARGISLVPDHAKAAAFLAAFRQWWDPGLVDAVAGLHQLGPGRNELAGVPAERLAPCLEDLLSREGHITRRTMFVAAHLAYALGRGQALAQGELQIMFPIHDRPRGVAAALLEDFPGARFVHTARDPAANLASGLRYVTRNRLNYRTAALELVARPLFLGRADGDTPSTAFGLRPYFAHLADQDRARFVRLEDLRQDMSSTLLATSIWLGLGPLRRPPASTVDAKDWWQGSESGVSENLARDDRRRIAAIHAASPVLCRLYPIRRQAHQAIATAWLGATPWLHGANDGNPVRSLLRLKRTGIPMPDAYRGWLTRSLRRELQRARLQAMNIGTVQVRERLPAHLRPCTLDSILLLRDDGERWRARILTRRPPDASTDRLRVDFLDDLGALPSPTEHCLWLLTLCLGGFLSQVSVLGQRMALTSACLTAARQAARAPQLRLMIEP